MTGQVLSSLHCPHSQINSETFPFNQFRHSNTQLAQLTPIPADFNSIQLTFNIDNIEKEPN